MIINKENVRVKPKSDEEILREKVNIEINKIVNKHKVKSEAFIYLFKQELDKWIEQVKK